MQMQNPGLNNTEHRHRHRNQELWCDCSEVVRPANRTRQHKSEKKVEKATIKFVFGPNRPPFDTKILWKLIYWWDNDFFVTYGTGTGIWAVMRKNSFISVCLTSWLIISLCLCLVVFSLLGGSFSFLRGSTCVHMCLKVCAFLWVGFWHLWKCHHHFGFLSVGPFCLFPLGVPPVSVWGVSVFDFLCNRCHHQLIAFSLSLPTRPSLSVLVFQGLAPYPHTSAIE